MTTLFFDRDNNRYIDEETGLVVPNPSGDLIHQARPDLDLPGYSYIPNSGPGTDPASLTEIYGVTPVRDAAGFFQLPDSLLATYSNNAAGGIKGFLNGPGALLLPISIVAPFVFAAGTAAGGAAALEGTTAAAAAPASIVQAAAAPVATGALESGAFLTAAEQGAISAAFPLTANVGTTGLLGLTAGETAAIGAAFPLTTGYAAAMGPVDLAALTTPAGFNWPSLPSPSLPNFPTPKYTLGDAANALKAGSALAGTAGALQALSGAGGASRTGVTPGGATLSGVGLQPASLDISASWMPLLLIAGGAVLIVAALSMKG